MNERIQELAKQCYDPEYGFIHPEQFAELIVLECARKTKEFVRAISTKGDAEASEDLLKQHFGVK